MKTSTTKTTTKTVPMFDFFVIKTTPLLHFYFCKDSMRVFQIE